MGWVERLELMSCPLELDRGKAWKELASGDELASSPAYQDGALSQAVVVGK